MVNMSMLMLVLCMVVSIVMAFILTRMSFIFYAMCMVTAHNVCRDVVMQETGKALNSDNPTEEAANKGIRS